MTLVKFALWGLAAPVLALGCGSSDPGNSSGSFPAAPYMVVASDSGALRIEVRTEPYQPVQRGTSSVLYTVKTANGDTLDGLTLNVTPWMPAMKHGSSVNPSVEPRGSGEYVVSPVNLFMAGLWELRTSISGPMSDQATPNLEVH